MKIFERKTPIIIEFSGAKIDLNKEFPCPECEEKTRITTDQVKNVASRLISVCVLFHERNRIIRKYEKGHFKDYFEYAVPLAQIEHQYYAIGESATSIATSIELPCGHTISVRIECGIKIIQEPKKIDVLHKLGVSTENSYRWLSYIYTGRVNKKFGTKKAAEITELVDEYYKQKQELEEFEKETLAKIPRSLTGLDQRLSADISKGVKLMSDDLDAIVKLVIHELDETLARVAMRPPIPSRGTPRGGWVAVGET